MEVISEMVQGITHFRIKSFHLPHELRSGDFNRKTHRRICSGSGAVQIQQLDDLILFREKGSLVQTGLKPISKVNSFFNSFQLRINPNQTSILFSHLRRGIYFPQDLVTLIWDGKTTFRSKFPYHCGNDFYQGSMTFLKRKIHLVWVIQKRQFFQIIKTEYFAD